MIIVTVESVGPARWVLVGGRVHLLAEERRGGVLVARCGQSLFRGVLLLSEQLPGRDWCVRCISAHLLPAPVFARTPTTWRKGGVSHGSA